ncbi:MAG TPA: V-type ATP synthase subunit I [Clostridiaceae bacterium]|nr:V-type ATP synthase subunit I [Clostridiaceae bacterium]
MAIAKMDKITVVGLASERDDVLDTLMRAGVLEIVSREDSVEQVSSETRATMEKNLSRLEQTSQQIAKRFPLVNAKLFQDKKQVSEAEFMLSSLAEEQTLEKLANWERLLAEESNLRQKQISLQEDLDQISHWQDLDIDLAVTGTQRTEIIYGVFSDPDELEAITIQLAEDHPETQIVRLRDIEEGTLAAIIMMREEAAYKKLLLQSADFHAIPNQLRIGKPNAILNDLRTRISAIDVELKEVQDKLAAQAEERASYWLLEDYYRVRLKRDSAARDLYGTEYTFYLSGWVPHDQTDLLVSTLTKNHDVAISSAPAQPEDNYPIKLQNNCFNKNFEVILTTFGAPSVNETDPTPVMGPFYMLLFGMMLSDVGYGLVLVAICALLLWKFKVSGDMQKMAKMLFVSGISSVVWGFVFGGFFGDMLTVLSNGKVDFPALWFNPMDDAMKLMIFSMLFGVVHLFAGMALQIRNSRLNGNLLNGLLDVVPWYLIVGGLLLYLAGSAGALGSVSDLSGKIGLYLALLGVAIIILFAGREAKNPLARLLKGVLALYDITGYLSDILSYTRILALVLATSVIAIVVNELGFLLGPSIVGYLLFAVIGILGHSLNLALSALSAYVHASRLQYVEMFGKFFQGGGRFFNPLRRETKYFQVSRGGDNSSIKRNGVS